MKINNIANCIFTKQGRSCTYNIIIPEPPDKVCTCSTKRLQAYHKQLCPGQKKRVIVSYNTADVNVNVNHYNP